MIVEPIRAALRDPFYRAERRQAGIGTHLLGPLGCLVAAAIAGFCCLGQILLYVTPLVVGAESLLYETDRGTLEGLLLTSADRGRILWAKLMARMKGLLWFSAALPVVGLLGGSAIAAAAAADKAGALPAVGLGALIGLGVGVLAGVQVTTQGLTGGALGILAALLGRTRGKSYLFCLLFSWLLSMSDGIVLGIPYVIFVIGAIGTAFTTSGGPGPSGGAGPVGMILTAVIALVAFTVLLVARIVLVNFLVTAKLMEHCARSMDQLLLKE